MPRYEYQCPRCSAVREITHTIAGCDTLLFPCRNCGEPMTRNIGTPLVRGVAIYPFTLKTIRATERDGKLNLDGDVVVENRTQHEDIMHRHKSVTPYLHGSKCNDAPNL